MDPEDLGRAALDQGDSASNLRRWAKATTVAGSRREIIVTDEVVRIVVRCEWKKWVEQEENGFQCGGRGMLSLCT